MTKLLIFMSPSAIMTLLLFGLSLQLHFIKERLCSRRSLQKKERPERMLS